MQKRGQVTVFVIVGVVIVILAVLVWYLRDSGNVVLPTMFLNFGAKKELIEKNLHDCVEKAVRPAVVLAALQGGDINPAAYVMYKGNKVSYLCMNIVDEKQCYNVMPPLKAVEGKLKQVVSKQIDNCVDRSLLDSVDVKGSRNLKVDLSIKQDSVVVDTNYDVTLVDKNIEVPIGNVRTVVSDIPFGELYYVALNIVNSEAVIGDFEQLFYMLAKKGKYEIQVARPFPDKVYIINKKNSNFKYQIAIQGESTIA